MNTIPDPNERASSVAAISLQDAKVLMVDDTPANIDVLRKVLAPEGYKLSFANSGEKALAIVAKALPDVILLDVMMPGMDGYETCKRLKQDVATQDIPVIFITAKTDVDDLVEGFQVGAVDYITKPFRQEEVIVRVKNHVQSRLLTKQRNALIDDLRATEQRFRQIATWSPIGIFQANAQGEIVYANPEYHRLFQQDEDSLGSTQCQWLPMVCEEDQQRLFPLWQQTIQQRKNFSAKCRLVRFKRDSLWIELNVVALQGQPNESFKGFIGTTKDISTEKNLEQQIRKAKEDAEVAMKAKAEYLANMAHELRTPLNAIIGYSEMLSDAVDSSDEAQDLNKITSASKYLLDLVNNILDLSKLDANKMHVKQEEVQIEVLAQDVIATIDPLVQKNQNRIYLSLAVGLPPALVTDRMKLKQILLNLLSNACKFTQNGEITLAICQAEEQNQAWLHFAVRDTGIGMTHEQLCRLFKRYAQAEKDTQFKFGGTGLGLVLSREFARLMGGDIIVASEAGKGSEFTLKLPLTLPPAEKTEKPTP